MCLQLKLLSLHTANESFKGINNDTSSPSKCFLAYAPAPQQQQQQPPQT